MTLVPQWLYGNAARFALTACCLTAGLAACNSTEKKVAAANEQVAEVVQDLDEASQDVRASWQEDWLNFKRVINEDVSKNELRIVDLRAEVALIDAQYREKYNRSIDDAERRNYELRDRVNNYEDQGDKKWAVFKTDVRQDVDELHTSIRNIMVRNS